MDFYEVDIKYHRLDYKKVDFKPSGAMKGIVKTYEDNIKKEKEKVKKRIEKSIS